MVDKPLYLRATGGKCGTYKGKVAVAGHVAQFICMYTS